MNLRFNQKFFLISAAALSFLAKNADALDPKVHLASGDTIGIENEWIVVLKPPADGGKRSRKLTVETVEAYAKSMDEVEVEEVYHAAIEGFTARMSESAADELAKNDEIESIEQNAVITADAVTWGLDRVDQRALPLNNQYNVEGDGSDVHAYIIDTGIQTSHNEFGGRARWGINTSGDGQNRDCNGHGTHVAGTVGGATYGVAQNVKLVAVKVLNCGGSGSYAGVIRGVEWVMTDAKGKKATANMSLGGGRSDAVNLAVRNLHTSGVPTVVAAGNNNGNACTKSPASERSVITVGSTTNTDIRSSFSNWGECVDLFAPGSSITAAWIGSNTATRTISGTSMASPHVCGGAALLLSAGVAADAIDEELIRKSTLDKVRNPGSQSPNRLLYVGEMGTRAPSPATVAPTPAPTKTPRPSITKKGTATQSSTCYGGNASRAIDGNTNGRYGNRSITHTCRNSKGSWWKVDLEGDNAIIDEIVVWNREDCCSHRLTGSVVEILNKDGNVVSSKTIPTATNVKKFSFEYDGVEGVEVRVLRPGSEFLSLAEVEVFGMITTLPPAPKTPAPTPAPTKTPRPINTPNHYYYMPVAEFPEETQASGHVLFSVAAKNDAHVALGEDTDHNGKHYEIVLGGWANGRSRIRGRNQNPTLAEYNGRVLGGYGAYVMFKISWDADMIKVELSGDNNEDTLEEIMVWNGRAGSSYNWTIKHMMIATGWGSTGLWKNIEY